VFVSEYRNTAFESRTAGRPAPGIPRAAALHAVLATAFTWPLVGHLGDRVPVDGYDALLNASLLWWNAHRVPFTSGWWNAPFFFPLRGTLALSETLLGLSPLTTPLQYLGASPLLAHNVAYLLSFPLCGLAMHLLVWELSERRDLALVGGLALAFAPYRAAHLAHLQVLCAFWIPLVFFGLHRFLRTGRFRWLALSATTWMLQGLTNAYFFLFLTVLVAAWVAWFVVPGRRWPALASISVTWGATALVPLLLFLQYGRWHARLGFERSTSEIESLSADLLGFVSPPAALANWALDTGLHAESWVFPGVTLPAVLAVSFLAWRRAEGGWLPAGRLAAAFATTAAVAAWVAGITGWIGPWRLTAGGLTLSVKLLHKPLAVAFYALIGAVASSPPLWRAWRRGSVPVFYGLASVASGILALGPTPRAAGVLVWDKAPYGLLLHLPGFASLRSPARFAMLLAFCLSCAAVLGLGRLTAGGRIRRHQIALVAAGVLWDGWIRPLPLAEPPLTFELPPGTPGRAAVLELPVGGERDTHAMYRATRHGRPVVNGYSGFDPAHYMALRQGLERGEPGVLCALRRRAPLLVLLDPGAPAAPVLRNLVLANGGRALSERPGGREAYVLPTAAPTSPVRPGSRIASRDVEGRRTRVLCDLGDVEAVGSLTLLFGRGVSRLPPRIVVEIAEAPPRWSVVWEGRVSGLALEAALRDPRRVPVVLYTPGARGRYVRLRLFDLLMVEDVAVFRPAGR
jgi:hypothetical protein